MQTIIEKTDIELQNDVLSELTYDPSGKVRNYTEIEEAERVAWSEPGVTEVDNHLTMN